jgi:anion exchange protein
MHGLQLLRQFLVSGQCAVGFGLTARPGEFPIADVILQTIRGSGVQELDEDGLKTIRDVLTAPHKHKDRKVKTTKKIESDADAAKKRMLRRRSGEGIDIGLSLYRYPRGADPETLAPYRPNKRLTKKLPKQCEVANILIGQLDFLTKPVVAFCRLDNPTVMADLSEVELPTRFAFVMLSPTEGGPPNAIWENSEVGRSLAALLADKVFCEVAYKAKKIQDLINGIDEFIDDLTVLPPSVWDPSTRLEPPKRTIAMDKVMLRLEDSTRGPSGPAAEPQEEGASSDHTLERTGRLFGGFINDVKNRYSLYWSDIKDGIHIQCLASTIFLFFACITPIVTFGGLMGQKTDGYMGTIECILSGAICGVIYAAFAGQPLTIVGATGPLLVFESILYHLCHENGLDFMSFRFWIGVWVMVALFIIVAFDLSALVRYITRFTEESFAILISVIFIYEAFTKIAEIYYHNPVRTGVTREDASKPWLYQCHCHPVPGAATSSNWTLTGNISWLSNITSPPDLYTNWTQNFDEDCITPNDRIEVRTGCISERQCQARGWNLTGAACFEYEYTHSVSDVFFLSVVLFVGTFALAYAFRIFRTSRFFSSFIRNTVADFAVFLSVMTWTCIDYAFGLTTPKLNVPAEFKPTRDDRGWVINPGAVTYWWMIPLAVIPALLATILVFLDQQITSVIVNRKEHKLVKPHGYHLDLFVLAISIFICSLLGLPWFVAATVRAITHVRSLLRESEVKIPGEKPQIVGVREQRVTGLGIHILIGLSTLLTSVLRLIPMPVLYGVFLYMGITSLGGVQFIERISILIMPVKYQPDYIFLRHCPTRRVHVFTLIQIVCFIGLWFIKSIKATSIAFPLMLVALMAARKLMDFVFTQSELYWLDHLLPGDERCKKEDEQARVKASHGRASISVAATGPGETQAFLVKEQEALGTKYRPKAK